MRRLDAEYGMNFVLQRTPRPDGLCVAVAGEVHAYPARELRTQLLDALRMYRRVTVDLSAVTFMDSQGLAALLRARKEAESTGACLGLEGVPPRVLKSLQLAGLDSVFTLDLIATEH